MPIVYPLIVIPGTLSTCVTYEYPLPPETVWIW
jgi:hypothetical protein